MKPSLKSGFYDRSISCLISLLLHGFMGLSLYLLSPQKLPSEKKSFVVPHTLTLKLVPPKISKIDAHETPAKRGTHDKKVVNKNQIRKSADIQPITSQDSEINTELPPRIPAPKPRNSYEALLPSGGGPIGNPEGSPNANTLYKGQGFHEIHTESAGIAAQFDLPLIFRRELDEGESHARLTLNADKSITLTSLNGEPILRAALFEALSENHSEDKIRRLFNQFNSKNITITIVFRTIMAPYADQEFTYLNRIFTNKVVISITKNLDVKKYGITGPGQIKDDAVIRTEKRDQKHYVRLQKSTAFGRALHNHKLFPAKS